MENQSNKNRTQQDDHSISKQSTEQHTQSTNDPIYKILIVIGGLLGLGTLAGIFLPAIILAIGMGLTDNPNRFKFELPYNAIDFQKIAYIDNQFVMYGIDYNSDSREHNLVIFNSKNGESWTKSVVGIIDDNQNAEISTMGTFNYFNGKCYLIGATVQPLVATDCKRWQTQMVNKLNGNNHYLYKAHDSAVANNQLYVTTDSGIYTTKNGETWQKEEIPRVTESSTQLAGFYSIATGNNKLITEADWGQNNQRRGLIYTKDLTTNKWSYVVYPAPLSHITRGKDRFVAMTESQALVLVDGDKNWNSIDIEKRPFKLVYGLSQFIGVSPIKISSNGVIWETILPNDKRLWGTSSIACNPTSCIAVGDKYQITYSRDGREWNIVEFNYKNAKPHWWKRFF